MTFRAEHLMIGPRAFFATFSSVFIVLFHPPHPSLLLHPSHSPLYLHSNRLPTLLSPFPLLVSHVPHSSSAIIGPFSSQKLRRLLGLFFLYIPEACSTSTSAFRQTIFTTTLLFPLFSVLRALLWRWHPLPSLSLSLSVPLDLHAKWREGKNYNGCHFAQIIDLFFSVEERRKKKQVFYEWTFITFVQFEISCLSSSSFFWRQWTIGIRPPPLPQLVWFNQRYFFLF